MEITHHRPSLTDFISVDVYERSTPDSFFDGPSVLYYHAKTVSLIVSKDDFDETAALQKLKPPSQAEAPSDPEAELTLPDLEIWASLAALLIYSPATSTGVSIPYPRIGIHALQTIQSAVSLLNDEPSPPQEGLYIQIDVNASLDAYDDEASALCITLIPSPSTPAEVPTQGPPRSTLLASDPINADKTSVQLLYRAMSHCSDLWPNTDSEDEQETIGGMYWEGRGDTGASEGVYGNQEGLPPPMPGSGGWITADNVGTFLDAEGNFRSGRNLPLGPGAGTVREREEDLEAMGVSRVSEGREPEENGEEEINGHGEAETKWRRTE